MALGIGSGLTALVLGAVVANRWFERRRGLVLGILTASSATGQLVFLPLASSLIAHYGWRIAVAPIVMACCVAAILALLLFQDRPGALGLAPYGAQPGTGGPAGVAWQPGFLEPLQALGSVSRSGVFWVLFGTFFVCGLSTSGLIQTHFIDLRLDFRGTSNGRRAPYPSFESPLRADSFP